MIKPVNTAKKFKKTILIKSISTVSSHNLKNAFCKNFYKNSTLRFKVLLQLNIHKTLFMQKYSQTLKLPILLNNEPLSLFYISKLLFDSERLFNFNVNKFKFIFFQLTESDRLRNELINVTRFTKYLNPFEFFMKSANVKSIKNLLDKRIKLLNYCNSPVLTDKLLKFENANTFIIKHLTITMQDAFILKNFFSLKNHKTNELKYLPFLFQNNKINVNFQKSNKIKHASVTSLFQILNFFSNPLYLKYFVNSSIYLPEYTPNVLKTRKLFFLFKEIV